MCINANAASMVCNEVVKKQAITDEIFAKDYCKKFFDEYKNKFIPIGLVNDTRYQPWFRYMCYTQ